MMATNKQKPETATPRRPGYRSAVVRRRQPSRASLFHIIRRSRPSGTGSPYCLYSTRLSSRRTRPPSCWARVTPACFQPTTFRRRPCRDPPTTRSSPYIRSSSWTYLSISCLLQISSSTSVRLTSTTERQVALSFHWSAIQRILNFLL